MPKNTKDKKDRDKFWSDNIFLNWIKLKFFNKFWNPYSWTIAKILLEQRNLNQTMLDRGHIQIWRYFTWSKKIKVFQWLSKSKFLSFMPKVNPNDEKETKSDIFSWDIFKSDIIFHWPQDTKIFWWLL